MIRKSRLAVAMLVALGCGSSPVMNGDSGGGGRMVTYSGDDWMDTFMQANYTRFYRVHVPARAEPVPEMPLVLALHGSSQTGSMLRAQTSLDRSADSAGFIVAYLEAAVGNWDVFGDLQEFGLDDVAYVDEVIDRVTQRYAIDRRRIIAVGLSNGGVMVQQLGCELTHRLAGFIAVAASMPRKLAASCQPSRPISALFMLGTVDPYFPVAGNNTVLSADSTMQFWAKVNGCWLGRTSSALPDIADDGTVVYLSRYRTCSRSVHTEIDSIVGGGHAWPDATIPPGPQLGPTSRDISGNAEIVRFLGEIQGR